MTIISSREYSRNPGKFIQRAEEGERVIISSKGVYVELKPVSVEDKDVKERQNAKSFLAHAERLRNDKMGKGYRRISSVEELHRWFDSL